MNTLQSLSLIYMLVFSPPSLDWGFFAHRKINHMAVFTLPEDMIDFYKKNLEYISEHAVDADKRKFATKQEAVRHYIDIDHWGGFPFKEVPRNRTDAYMKYTSLYVVNGTDTLELLNAEQFEIDSLSINISLADSTQIQISKVAYRQFFKSKILNNFYESKIQDIELSLLDEKFKKPGFRYFSKDNFTAYGILPFHLMRMKYSLTKAFKNLEYKKIKRLSADIGHYIGDAHVPLHTTENYDGKMTQQDGIHAFWESRLPELFAEKEYNFFVGKAIYIDDVQKYFWEIILQSHRDLEKVLAIEKEIQQTFKKDQQFCWDLRLDATQFIQCEAYAKAYHEALNGMVERRMRGAIKALGNIWFTCWVDAGQPKL